MDRHVERGVNNRSLLYGFAFIISGIAINNLGAVISSHFDLPLYLDTVGTVLISAIGGSLPGVMVGFLSSVINGFVDQANIYYALINVIIAFFVSFIADRGLFKKPLHALASAIPLGIICAFFSNIITAGLYGAGFSDGSSGDIARAISEKWGLSERLSQMLGDMILDSADKLVTFAIAIILIYLITKYFHEDMHLHVWRQRPLSADELKEVNSVKPSRTISLRARLLIIISVIVLIIAFVTSYISYTLYSNATLEERKQTSIGVAKLIAAVIDADKIQEYIEKGDSLEEYRDIERRLENIRYTSNDILYVYVYRIEPDGCHVVFDLDTEDTPGGNAGDIVEFDEAYAPYLDDLLKGNSIDVVVSDETFGWLLTDYEPIRDASGKTQAYACVDISMDSVRANQTAYMTKVVTLFAGFFFTIIAIGLWLAEYYLVLPVNTMALAARKFIYKSEEDRQESVNKFNGLQISTGDEIENLYDSFEMTIDETIQYIAETQRQAVQLSKMQNGLIMVLADMVESRDQCTGDHVRKTAAYCKIILEQLRKDGKFTDILTDDYIADVVNSAPLHDIGKIKVADAILNKPGKLTDEEFAEMKKHTLAGNEIIQQAIELVSVDSSYLKEAKNLATYHHEKWNGKGYPTGISGEEIPLSARVMAVADVFDALVSRRSYKEPFTFEQAMDIINEGSGSHFDPTVVQAFNEVRDEARRISETFMGTGTSEVPAPEIAKA